MVAEAECCPALQPDRAAPGHAPSAHVVNPKTLSAIRSALGVRLSEVIVGVDCATVHTKVGVALAERVDGRWHLKEVAAGAKIHPFDQIEAWLGEGHDSLLFALDAPLGWPRGLSESLLHHQAGQPLSIGPDFLFRRETDRFVQHLTGKRALDVGADRIARTAQWALLFLSIVRQSLQEPVPLAWGTPLGSRAAAIEVYPAATLLSHGCSLQDYKKKAEGRAARNRIYAILEEKLVCDPKCITAVDNADAIDAIACVLAGIDFLDGKAVPPIDLPLAQQEGWIWVRPPHRGIAIENGGTNGG